VELDLYITLFFMCVYFSGTAVNMQTLTLDIA